MSRVVRVQCKALEFAEVFTQDDGRSTQGFTSENAEAAEAILTLGLWILDVLCDEEFPLADAAMFSVEHNNN